MLLRREVGQNAERNALAASGDNIIECPHCGKEGKQHDIKRHVKFCTGNSQKKGKVNDMGWTDTRKTKGGGKPLLHGGDLPKAVDSVKVTVKECREAPENFGAFYILDFTKPVYDAEGWAVNKTNGDLLAEKYGDNWPEEIAGKTIMLKTMMVNNPQTKKPVRSLFVA